MTDERRAVTRNPDFVDVELVTTDSVGQEVAYPIILRDRSGSGLGAMYIGKEVLSPRREFVLRGGNHDDRRVRIVWTKQVADFVVMIGMEVATG
jgi:hypothetical protein